MKKTTLFTLTTLSLCLSACQTLSLPTSSGRALQNERSNILTSNQVSAGTLSVLLSAGLSMSDCMAQFDACVTAVDQTFFDDNSKYKLATLAELHYAHSLHLKEFHACKPIIDRPPIDPYYANAPIPKDKQAEQQNAHRACLADLRQALFGSLNHSYAYLFFESLNPSSTSTSPKNRSPVINETDLKAHDLYHISVNDIIHEVYQQEQGAFANQSLSTYDNKASQSAQVKVSTIYTTSHDTAHGDGYTLDLYLANDPYYLQNTAQGQAHALSDLVSQYDPRLARLDVVSKRSGLGVGYVGSLNDRYTASVRDTLGSFGRKNNDPVKEDMVAQASNKNLDDVDNSDGLDSLDNLGGLDSLGGLDNLNNLNNADNLNNLDNLNGSDNLGNLAYLNNSDNPNNLNDLNNLNNPNSLTDLDNSANSDSLDSSDSLANSSVFDSLDDLDDPSSRIHPMGHLLLTALITPEGDTLDEVLNAHKHNAYFFNPYTTDSVNILGEDYPLSANFSAGYALWLSENELRELALINMLTKKEARLPELFMLEPYNPDKKVIIMLHGLASSPRTWVNLTNNLFADPILRENYQVWQVFYATNLPILENRYQIQKLIETAYHNTDPTAKNRASHDSILIGHSMGGVISRMMLSRDDLAAKLATLDNHDTKRLLRGTDFSADLQKESNFPSQEHISSHANQHVNDGLTDNLPNGLDNGLDNGLNISANHAFSHDVDSLSDTTKPNDQMATPISAKAQLDAITQSEVGTEFSKRLSLHPLPQVSTAVFISSPFRGTDYADRWFTRMARRIIRLPLSITQAASNALVSIGEPDTLGDTIVGGLYLQNGASQLSNQSSFMKLTRDIKIAEGVRYHSIMANNTNALLPTAIDEMDERAFDEDNLPLSENAMSNLKIKAPRKASEDSANSTASELDEGDLFLREDITISDGIVPYTSSHLAGASSEHILQGGHSIHENPQTILYLREILHNHLQNHPTNPDSTAK